MFQESIFIHVDFSYFSQASAVPGQLYFQRLNEK